MPTRIHFQPNEPQTFKLVDPAGEYDFELQTGRYQTTDGRELQLPRPAVIALNAVAPAPGEEIMICRYDPKHRGELATWTVYLTTQSEKARAEAETALESPDAEPSLQHQLAASIKAANNAKRRNGHPTPIRKEPAPAETLQPRLFDQRGTGTDGPAPQRVPLIPAASAPTRRDRPMPIPWNVAFREVSAWVSKELASNSLQWSDQAQQAMVCTVLIAEAKAGRVTVWERAE